MDLCESPHGGIRSRFFQVSVSAAHLQHWLSLCFCLFTETSSFKTSSYFRLSSFHIVPAALQHTCFSRFSQNPVLSYFTAPTVRVETSSSRSPQSHHGPSLVLRASSSSSVHLRRPSVCRKPAEAGMLRLHSAGPGWWRESRWEGHRCWSRWRSRCLWAPTLGGGGGGGGLDTLDADEEPRRDTHRYCWWHRWRQKRETWTRGLRWSL